MPVSPICVSGSVLVCGCGLVTGTDVCALWLVIVCEADVALFWLLVVVIASRVVIWIWKDLVAFATTRVLANTQACAVRLHTPVDEGAWTLFRRAIFQVLGVTSVPNPRLLCERLVVELVSEMSTLVSRNWVVPLQETARYVLIAMFCPGFAVSGVSMFEICNVQRGGVA